MFCSTFDHHLELNHDPAFKTPIPPGPTRRTQAQCGSLLRWSPWGASLSRRPSVPTGTESRAVHWSPPELLPCIDAKPGNTSCIKGKETDEGCGTKVYCNSFNYLHPQTGSNPPGGSPRYKPLYKTANHCLENHYIKGQTPTKEWIDRPAVPCSGKKQWQNNRQGLWHLGVLQCDPVSPRVDRREIRVLLGMPCRPQAQKSAKDSRLSAPGHVGGGRGAHNHPREK